MTNSVRVRAFVAESNRIEGITRTPTEMECRVTAAFLFARTISVSDMSELVSVYQPDAELRDRVGLNVRVGNHIAPPGGPEIVTALTVLIAVAHDDKADPWDIHCRYEHLHPFTDGNGRSGRALWAWMQRRRGDDLSLGFLHRFYYQTLERADD